MWEQLSHESVLEYYNDQVYEKTFVGTLDEFIDEYDLHLEMYLLESFADWMSQIDEVLIDICW
jgi:hypothetical protein